MRGQRGGIGRLVGEVPLNGLPSDTEIHTKAKESFVGKVNGVAYTAHALVNNCGRDRGVAVHNLDSSAAVWVTVGLSAHHAHWKCNHSVAIAIAVGATGAQSSLIVGHVTCARTARCARALNELSSLSGAGNGGGGLGSWCACDWGRSLGSCGRRNIGRCCRLFLRLCLCLCLCDRSG